MARDGGNLGGGSTVEEEVAPLGREGGREGDCECWIESQRTDGGREGEREEGREGRREGGRAGLNAPECPGRRIRGWRG